MFSETGVSAVCSCENVTVKTIAAPETKFGYWITLDYQDSTPLIIEKISELGTIGRKVRQLKI